MTVVGDDFLTSVSHPFETYRKNSEEEESVSYKQFIQWKLTPLQVEYQKQEKNRHQAGAMWKCGSHVFKLKTEKRIGKPRGTEA